MEKKIHIRQFSKTLLIALALFHFSLGVLLLLNPDIILVYLDGDITTTPYTICKLTGATNIILGLFIFEAVRSKIDLLRPIIYVLILNFLTIYLAFTVKENIHLSLSIYTWKFITSALLIIALISELLSRSKDR